MLRELGADLEAGTSEEFASRIRQNIATWAEVIRTSRVRRD